MNNTNSNGNIEMKRKDGNTEYMTQAEFSRWACLVEGIQAVDQKLMNAS